MRSIVVVAGLVALALAACGGSSAKPDGSADGSADTGGGGAAGHGGAGAAGRGGAGGAIGAGGASGASGASGATGGGGSSGLGGGAGAAAGHDGGAAGQGGAAGLRDGGTDARTDSGGCPSQNPDPCICGRPDANSISAAECVHEKACRAAGGVWEPYLVFLPEGGSYGPRCQSPDGSAFDAS